MRLRFLAALLFSMFWVSFAWAATPSSILVNLAPENPAPGESVNISLSSYSNNLDSVRIEWLVNGKTTLAGTGKKSFSLKAGEEGSSTTIEAHVMLPDGEIDKRIVIAPKVMTLLWQANDSYVPPFYKGKAMPVEESEIKIVAIPEAKNSNGTNNSTDMVYDWKQDYENVPEASGYGKNYFTYTNDYLDPSSTISVNASTVDQKYSSSANVDVPTATPKLIFYKQEKSMGTNWDAALTDGHKIEGEEVIVAAPYFIAPKNLYVPLLNWVWSINGSGVGESVGAPYMLPIKVENGKTGTSTIGLNISNSSKIFQTASKQIDVQF
jgi:hypothetical protein